ncbi:hypothetical protein [Pasteurella oralis]|uniref:hypothetical protein n=1 Tax=Pasteurella oralis TaxID=1071947 RepID=UPI000C7C2DF3|nr:hypothetical protein [Pasteurella oralis]
MRHLKYSLFLASVALITGCAELTAINKQIGDIAGSLNNTINNKRYFNENITSHKDIDTVYLRIKREIGFKTEAEALGKTWGTNRNWKKIGLEQDGFIHEKNPGVYYQMADSFGPESRYYVKVTLEKAGKNTQIYWEVDGTESFANQIKTSILKAIK